MTLDPLRMGVARIFQRGGHTDSYIGYSPNCHLNIVGCLLTKRLTKGGSRAPQDPPWLRPCFTVVKRKGVSVELARGQARLFRNVSMVKKVIPTTRNSELVRRSTQGVTLPSHGNITVENTERCDRPVRERRVPSYLNDFLLS